MGNETETRLCNALVEQANAVAERFGNDPDTPGLEADFERVTKSHEDLINRFGRDIDISGAALGWWQSAGEAATADANLRLVDTTVSFNGVRLMERYQLLHLRMLPFFEARIDWLRGNRRFEGLLHACEQVLRFDPGNDRAHAALCHIEREARQPEEVAP